MTHKADDIFEAVCRLTGLPPSEFRSSHRGPVANGRMILAGVMRHYCKRLSYPEIAATYLGTGWHSSVLSAYHRWMRMPEPQREEWLTRVAVLSEVAEANRMHAERESRKVEAELRWCAKLQKRKAKKRIAA